jgi:hypothetical protein
MFLTLFFGSLHDPDFDLKISGVFIKMITCSKKKKKKNDLIKIIVVTSLNLILFFDIRH